MISSGVHAFRNFVLYRIWPVNRFMQRRWQRPLDGVEGALIEDARAIRAAVSVPVLCTGGFQTASVIRDALESGACDAVTIARPLVANPDLPRLFAAGRTARRARARTATSASSTSSRARSAATTNDGSRAGRR